MWKVKRYLLFSLLYIACSANSETYELNRNKPDVEVKYTPLGPLLKCKFL